MSGVASSVYLVQAMVQKAVKARQVGGVQVVVHHPLGARQVGGVPWEPLVVSAAHHVIGSYKRSRVWISLVPTHSFWFTRFMSGMHKMV
jgi:hypothetical protein